MEYLVTHAHAFRDPLHHPLRFTFGQAASVGGASGRDNTNTNKGSRVAHSLSYAGRRHKVAATTRSRDSGLCHLSAASKTDLTVSGTNAGPDMLWVGGYGNKTNKNRRSPNPTIQILLLFYSGGTNFGEDQTLDN